MNLSLSNFAWDNEESEIIFDEIKKIGIFNIEGVLTKLASWENLSDNKIIEYKKILNSKDIRLESLQSLFYGVKCDGIKDDDIFINHFKRLIEISKLLSSKILVFGSPGLRKKYEGWEEHLTKVFKELDLILEGTGIQISIEPNSKIYGGDYFFTVSEIVEFITKNKLNNIKTMIDTHNIILENSDPIIDFEKYYTYINHIHISENKLEIIKNFNFHINFSNHIKKLKYGKIITYEVIKCENVLNSVNKFYEIYK
jgi:sugar phosphate isomerase/epimerase